MIIGCLPWFRKKSLEFCSFLIRLWQETDINLMNHVIVDPILQLNRAKQTQSKKKENLNRLISQPHTRNTALSKQIEVTQTHANSRRRCLVFPQLVKYRPLSLNKEKKIKFMSICQALCKIKAHVLAMKDIMKFL